MSKIGIIGSTGIKIELLVDDYTFETVQVGEKTFKYYHGHIGDTEIFLTARNQYNGAVPPHKVDYKLIMEGLKTVGAEVIVGTSVSGSLRLEIPPKTYLVLDQFLDIRKSTPHTVFDGDRFSFVDFSEPYCPSVRSYLIKACEGAGVSFLPRGCYVGDDGPRYETNAEVRMFNLLGGDVVGMTNVPETIMAREMGLCYASLSVVSNYGAGLGNKEEVLRKDCYDATMEALEGTISVLKKFIELYNGKKICSCATKISDMLGN